MIRRVLPLTLVVAAVAASQLSAGGWAVVTVDSLPHSFVAATPTRISFVVRQHGVEPLDGLEPTVQAQAGQDHIKGTARPTGQKGQYALTLTFPRAAEWVVTIDSGFGQNSRLRLLPVRVAASGQPPSSTPAERGMQLFVAKGCVTCHQNSVASGNLGLNFAPPMVAGKYQAEFLQRILADPSALPAQPGAFVRMPKLNLDAQEIASLVAFINASGTAVTAAR